MEAYTVREIPRYMGIMYIRENHYTGTCQNSPNVCLGLFEGDLLIGVCIFAAPCSEEARASIFGREHKDRVIELHRLHILDCTPRNTESWFVSRCLKFLAAKLPHIRAVISFADSTAGHTGVIYRALNAFYYGKTRREPAWIDHEGRLRHRRQNGKHVDGVSLGWTKTYREPKFRYFWIIGNKREKREWYKLLKVKLIKYE